MPDFIIFIGLRGKVNEHCYFSLQAVAESKMAEMKEKSTLGMQYAVQNHTFIDIDVDIAASIIIVPQTGMYKG